MEKQTQAKPKSKIMRFLPKATSSVSFQNPPQDQKRSSENNTSKLKSHFGGGKGFSGPMISIIPAEARGKPKYGSSFGTQEPTSPKVSCMGQIKHKKEIHKMKKRVASTSSQPNQQQQPPKPALPPPHPHPLSKPPKELKKQTSSTTALRRIFGRTKSAGRKSDASADRPTKVVMPQRAPSLGQMRRFASGRDTFANFEWTAQIAPVDSDHRDYNSDEDRGESEEEEEEVIIPFSAPILMGGGVVVALEPRKEINLWKRRTMAPPRPLQLNTLFISK